MDDDPDTALDTPARRTSRSRRPATLWKDPSLKRLMGENLRRQWKLYALAVVAMVFVAATTAGTAFIMRDIVDTMTLPEKKDYVFWVAGAVAAIFTVKGLATYVQVVTLTQAGLQVVALQQSRIYDKLLRQGLSFFNERNSSNLVMRVTHGANAARTIMDVFLTSYIRDLLTLIGLIGVMVYQQPFLSVIALLVGPVAILGVRQLLKASRQMADQEMNSLSQIIKVMQETAAGVRVIKAFSLEQRMAGRMERAIRDVEARANRFARIQATVSPLMDTLSGLAIAAIVALSSVKFLGLESTTPGSLMSFISALLMAYEPAKRLMRARVQIERSLAMVERMFDLLDAPETMPEHPDAKPLPDGAGEITFEDVRFGYGSKKVLTGISLTFEPKKTTALVGPSGGGKSTMMNLILRMYDPTEGRVLIDGHDLSQATNDSLRSKIAFVSQDTFLFSSSVMENIRIGRADATDEEVIEAAKLAHADEFIAEMKHGYHTKVGENGALLSGGQKQRLAIARAIVRRAPILLLDEATSALDAHSEALVRDALASVSKNVTTVVIAHRLSTILTADRICYVEAGQVQETGTLQELLDLNGRFRSLYDKQFRRTGTSLAATDHDTTAADDDDQLFVG